MLVLNQFGGSYDNLVAELTKAHRNREVQCLLLADMPEIASFPGHFERIAGGMRCLSCGAAGVFGKFCRQCGHALQQVAPPSADTSCPNCGAHGQSGHFCHECGHALPSDAAALPASGGAEIRLYKTNLAVLPEHSPGFQVRLGDVAQVRHESSSYEVFLDCGNESLKFSALGKRTREFAEEVRSAMSGMAAASGQALHLAFPFLNPDQLQQVATLLPEGSSAAVSKLNEVDAGISAALVANAIDKDLQPYYQELVSRSVAGSIHAGFKLIRPEDCGPETPKEDDESQVDGDAPDADQKGPDVLYWFFFPIATEGSKPNVVAWEASSSGGRATYFFRLDTSAQELDEQIRRLNRGLAILNFRRRPIYLSDAELAMNPIFRRYAIAARRIPEVRQLRAAFLGRAIHSSVEAWRTQVDGILVRPS